MRYEIKLMYSDGFPLSREQVEVGPTYTGFLVVQHWPEKGKPDRFLSQARLIQSSDLRDVENVIPPLMNPNFLQTSEGRMLLHGYQIIVEGGRVRHISQAWIARPLIDEPEDEQQELW